MNAFAETGPEPIAIVGMGCVFPSARDLDQYWRNILGKVDAVAAAPDDWGSGLLLDPDSAENDRIYTDRGGFLRDLARFDPLRHGVMPNSVDGGEPDQFLALEVAADAVEDADFAARPIPGDRVAVILGRGTYINRGFTNVVQHGMMVDRFLDILRRLHPDTGEDEAAALKAELKASLPPFNAEMAPALVPNLVTGRISNRLNFRGANYIIDAACASSLIALERGMADLRSGACDMVLVGGVHASTPAPIYQIFCQLGALSRKGRIRPFSQEADGTLLAEGVGILCIKRLSDAEASGDRIYALVRSVGVASDGKGMSVLAPRLDGERLAIRRAYDSAGVDPATVGLIEAHGTATTVGDATEVQALTAEFGATGSPCALGTVKSMIGHCLPASGSAGLIKAALALHHRVLPPTLVDTSNPDLGLADSGFYLNTEARPWIHGVATPRRAGVNAFGFGGINAHAVLEEYTGAPAPAAVIARDSELIAFDAPDIAQAGARIDAVAARIGAGPDLAAAARAVHKECGQGSCRMAIVARTSEDALERLLLLRAGLAKGRTRLRDRRGAYFSTDPLAADGKVAFMFPGEGSQSRNMLAPLMLHYPAMRNWFDLMDGAYAHDPDRIPPSTVFFPPPLATVDDTDLWRMDVGPEAIFAANMAVATLYEKIGLTADMLVGHSTGEYAALFAAGVTARDDPATLQREIRGLNAVFATAQDAGDIAAGTLFTIGAVDAARLKDAIAARDDVFLGMDNCPGQQVVAATTASGAEWVVRLGAQMGGICEKLPFARAYHCAAFRPFSDRLGKFLDGVDIAAPRRPVYSCLTASRFPDDPQRIRQMVADQWSAQVRFSDTIRAMHDDGARIFVECGPRNNLTAFVNDTLRKSPHLAVAVDTTARQGLEQLHHMAAQLIVEGVELDLDALGAGVLVQRGSPDAKPLNMGLQPMDLAKGPRPPRQSTAPVAAPVPDPTPAKAPVGMESVVASYFSTMEKLVATEQSVMAAYLQSGGHVTPASADRFPMLSQVDIAPDRQSLSAQVTVDHGCAPYLADHSFGRATSMNEPGRHGLSVVPLTFTMEALAEAAAALRPDLQVTTLHEIRGSRWISIEKPRQVRLEVTAQIIRDGESVLVRTRLRDADGSAIRPVIAEGDVELAPARTAPPAAPLSTRTTKPKSPWSQTDIYGRIMFHGPRLQAVESMDLATVDGAEGGLVGLPHGDLFTGARNPVFETDAITLDAVGQLVGVWSVDQLSEAFHIFPFRIERVEIFRHNLGPGERARCRCSIALVGADEMRSDIDVVTGDGRVQSRITGWWDKRFDLPSRFFSARLDPARNAISAIPAPDPALPGIRLAICDSLDDELLDGSGGIWAGVLGGLVLSDAEAGEWRETGPEPNARFDWIRRRIAAKDAIRAWRGTELCPADLRIATNAAGQSRLIDGWPDDWGPVPQVAVAGSGGIAVAVASDPRIHTRVGVAMLRDMIGGNVGATGHEDEPERTSDGSEQTAKMAGWLDLAKTAALGTINAADDPSGDRFEMTQQDATGANLRLRDRATAEDIAVYVIRDPGCKLTIAVATRAEG